MKNSTINQIQKSYLKYSLINNLRSPSFYILSILFSVFLCINYFIRHQFFTGNGTTDLLLFFSSIPYISIIVIPSLCYKQSFSVYDELIPLQNIDKITITFITRFILFSFMLILLLPPTLLVSLFGSIDWGQFFISFVCLFFYGSSVISLCTFLEKLINNKISTFIISALLLAIFNSAHLFTVYVPLPSFLTTIFQEFSFAWHFDSASKGILNTKDILFFFGTTFLFIILANITEEKKKGKIFTNKEKIRNIAKILLSLLIILNGNRWYKRVDFSVNKIYSPSRYTKSLIQKVDSTVKITYYRSSSIAKLYPQIRDVSDFLVTYSALSKNVSLIIKDPEKDEKSRILLENYGIQSQQLKTVSSNSTEYINVYSTIVIENDGYVEILPFTMSANTLEYDLDLRIKQLLTKTKRTINIIIANGMTNQDYSYLIPWLQSQSFNCNSLDITSSTFANDIRNTQGPLVVIGDSKILIENAIVIEEYILKNNENALFMVNPYSVDIEENWYLKANQNTNIIEILENWGILFTPQIAADISCARLTMFADDNSEAKNLNYPLWLSILQQKNTNLGATLFWATPLELQNNAKPYLQTSPVAYTYPIQKGNKQSLIETNPFILQTANVSDKEKTTLTVGAELQGALQGLFTTYSSENSHIIVIPDQYFVNSLMNEYISGDFADYRNFEFVTNCLLKLNGEEDLATLQAKSSRDTSFYKITDIAQFSLYKLIVYLVCFVLIPLVCVATGVYWYVFKK